MSDPEAKARSKMAEAEKKTKGGHGFFGKIFGGGGSDEAADLFVQEPTTACTSTRSVWRTTGDDKYSDSGDDNNEDDDYSDEDTSIICCEIEGCDETFPDEPAFEDHYHTIHSHQCSSCGRSLPTVYCLDIHIEEHHSSYFKALFEKKADMPPFKCLSSTCQAIFHNPLERNEHSVKEHNIMSMEVFDERRKLKRRQDHETSKLMQSLHVTSESEAKAYSSKHSAVAPVEVRFGIESNASFTSQEKPSKPRVIAIPTRRKH